MGARAIASGTIHFGLVCIPVKLYVAASSERVHFHLLERATGRRVKQQYASASTGAALRKDELAKGYEYVRGQCVELIDDELRVIEADRTGAMEIREFVPDDSIDPLRIAKSYYLGPDKGAEAGFHMLADAMADSGVVAIARWKTKGKDELVALRSAYRGGICLHQLFYATEMRPPPEPPAPPPEGDWYGNLVTDRAVTLATRLVRSMTKPFQPSKYRDSYGDRVRELVQRKMSGRALTLELTASAPPRFLPIEEALRMSVDIANPSRTSRGLGSSIESLAKRMSSAHEELEQRARPRKQAAKRAK